MGLTFEQLKRIEKYLDFKELNQIDLREEVLDHMANSIEVALEKGSSFSDAFNLEIKKWNKDLELYSSFWLGIAWVGPKIMIKKCIRLIKKIYFVSIPISILITAISVLIFNFISEKLFYKTLDICISGIFIGLFLMYAVGFFCIKKSKTETTYQYFYKIQGWGWSCVLVSLNPMFSSQQYYTQNMGFYKLFLPVFSLVFFCHLFKIYSEHFGVAKQKLV